MNPSYTTELFDTFPDVFNQRLLNNGFRCQDGWFGLLSELGLSLRIYCSQIPVVDYPVITSVVQEKGALKVTTRGTDPGFNALIRNAEETSRTICELDGNPAAGCYAYAPVWFRPLCKTCADMHDCMTMETFLRSNARPGFWG